jgi:hypothetical protein
MAVNPGKAAAIISARGSGGTNPVSFGTLLSC